MRVLGSRHRPDHVEIAINEADGNSMASSQSCGTFVLTEVSAYPVEGQVERSLPPIRNQIPRYGEQVLF
jgi:hypothetical protein